MNGLFRPYRSSRRIPFRRQSALMSDPGLWRARDARDHTIGVEWTVAYSFPWATLSERSAGLVEPRATGPQSARKSPSGHLGINLCRATTRSSTVARSGATSAKQIGPSDSAADREPWALGASSAGAALFLFSVSEDLLVQAELARRQHDVAIERARSVGYRPDSQEMAALCAADRQCRCASSRQRADQTQAEAPSA